MKRSKVDGADPWQAVERGLEWYADRHDFSSLLPWTYRREGLFVVARTLLIAAFSVATFATENWIWRALLLLGSTVLLADALMTTTAHAFTMKPSKPLRSVVRFVLLNIMTYFSLTFWFTLYLAPVSAHFAPALHWSTAFELAFALVTASAVADPADALNWRAWSVIGASQILSLYWLLVILVAAVSRVEYQTHTIKEDRK